VVASLTVACVPEVTLTVACVPEVTLTVACVPEVTLTVACVPEVKLPLGLDDLKSMILISDRRTTNGFRLNLI
jgi:hypothetical protein